MEALLPVDKRMMENRGRRLDLEDHPQVEAKLKKKEILPSLAIVVIRAGQMILRTLPVQSGLMVFWFSAWRNPPWMTLPLSSPTS